MVKKVKLSKYWYKFQYIKSMRNLVTDSPSELPSLNITEYVKDYDKRDFNSSENIQYLLMRRNLNMVINLSSHAWPWWCTT